MNLAQKANTWNGVMMMSHIVLFVHPDVKNAKMIGLAKNVKMLII